MQKQFPLVPRTERLFAVVGAAIVTMLQALTVGRIDALMYAGSALVVMWAYPWHWLVVADGEAKVLLLKRERWSSRGGPWVDVEVVSRFGIRRVNLVAADGRRVTVPHLSDPPLFPDPDFDAKVDALQSVLVALKAA